MAPAVALVDQKFPHNGVIVSPFVPGRPLAADAIQVLANGARCPPGWRHAEIISRSAHVEPSPVRRHPRHPEPLGHLPVADVGLDQLRRGEPHPLPAGTPVNAVGAGEM